MKAILSLFRRRVVGSVAVLVAAHALAAPLAWFPGPALDVGVSGAAAINERGALVLVGGDSSSSGFSYPQSLGATNSFWTYLPALFGTHIGAGAATAGGMILIYGGNDGTNATNAAFGYSPSGDSPMDVAPLNVARAYLGYATDSSGGAYAIGGLGADGQPLSSVERYDSDSNSWIFLTSLPTPLYNFPAVFDGKDSIYVFGGRTNASSGGEVNIVRRYSINGNSWTLKAPMPIAAAGSAAVAGPDGMVYVAGGVSAGAALDAVQAYDPVLDSWKLVAPLPEALSGASMGVDALGRLVVAGGTDVNGNDSANVWRSQRLSIPDAAPAFVEYPTTNGVYLENYTSAISAAGNPPPVYLLLNGPKGMQVDLYSGAISWTPQADAIGANMATIRATNYAGFVDWSFFIHIPNPPPSTPTNLTVVAATDNSVTLSWAAEAATVGPASFNIYIPHPWHSPRGSGGGVNYQLIASGISSPSATVSGLLPGRSYNFVVKAQAPGGASGYSAWIGATTTSPQAPAQLAVTELTPTTVGLAWSPSPGPAQNPLFSPITRYAIMERKMSVYPPVNVPVVTNIAGTNGVVAGLVPGQTHLWYIAGVDAAGNYSPFGAAYLSLTNPVSTSPFLGASVTLTNGMLQLTAELQGSVAQTWWVQATTNLANPGGWVQIGAIESGALPIRFTDTNSVQYPARFYRVIAP